MSATSDDEVIGHRTDFRDRLRRASTLVAGKDAGQLESRGNEVIGHHGTQITESDFLCGSHTESWWASNEMCSAE